MNDSLVRYGVVSGMFLACCKAQFNASESAFACGCFSC